MTTEQTYDPRKYPVCPPHTGEKGEPYTRRFRPDFISNLWGENDDYSSLAEHALHVECRRVP